MAVGRNLNNFNAQEIANTAWAFAKAKLLDALLFAKPTTAGQLDTSVLGALAIAAQRRLSELSPQNLANMAWAFVTVGQLGTPLLLTIAKVVERSAW